MRRLADAYLHALRATTTLAWPGAARAVPLPPDDVRAHEPGVGWFVGLASCLAFAVAGLPLRDNPFEPLVGAVASTIVTLCVTGARDEVLAAGRFGDEARRTLALVLALLLKIALLAALAAQAPVAALAALLAGHVIGRAAPLLAAPPEGRARWIALAWTAAALVLAVLARGVVFAAFALAASALASWLVRRRWRTASPDPATACAQLRQGCELAFYAGAAIAWNAR